MTPFTVRSAQDQDAEQMASIAASQPTSPQWTAAQFRESMQPRAEDGTLCRSVLVAELAGELGGFAVASALCNVFPVEAELESLAVSPTLQGRGIGRHLLEATSAWAAGLHFEKLRLEVRASNSRAIHLYESSGFRAIGRRPAYYAAPIEDAVLMERTVSALHGGKSITPLA